MKRLLCAVLTLVMILTALAVPVSAQEGGVVPTQLKRTQDREFWVELAGATLIEDGKPGDYSREHDDNGIATLTCDQEDAWWAEKYAVNAPEIKVIFQVPEGAYSYKAAFLKQLPEGAYSFDEDALCPDGLEKLEEVQIRRPVGEIENDRLILDKDPFYALITWFDQEGKPMFEGKIEYIKVDVDFSEASNSIQLPVSPVVPLPQERFAWWLADMNDGEFGSDMDTPGVQRITFLYTLQDWADSWNQNQHKEPAVEAVIIAPEDAVAYMEITSDKVDGFSPQEALAQTEGWIELEPSEEDKVIPLRYKVGEIQENEGKYTFTTIGHEDQKLIVWKTEQNTLVDLGDEQYIESFTMRISHETGYQYTTAEIEKIEIDKMIAYQSGTPQITGVYEQSNTEVPETLSGKLDNGTFAMQAALTQEEMQAIYNSKPAGNEQLWYHVVLPMPQGAQDAWSFTSAEFDENAYQFIEEAGYPAIDIGDKKVMRTSVTFASVRRHESEVMIDPCNVDKWVYVMWLDGNGNPVNIGTVEAPCYVEYLHVTLNHDSMDTVTVTDESTVSKSDVVLNASGWTNDMFSRETDLVNSEVVYFVNRDKLIELQEQNNGTLPEDKQALHTYLKAPKHAEKYELTLTTLGQHWSGAVDQKDGYVDLITPMTEERDGKQEVPTLIIQQYEVRWLDKKGELIGRQKMTITVWMTANQTWMDIMENGQWDAAAKDRIGSTQDNTDIAAVADKDGAVRIQYNTECPENDELKVTLKAPEDSAGITHYRMASVQGMYVYMYTSDNEGIMAEARYKLDEFVPQVLSEDRKVVFNGLATFATEEIAVDKGNKNFTNTIYLHETYNNNIEDCMVMFVEWMDESGNVLEREYVYHEPERLDYAVKDERYRIEKDNNGNHYGYLLGVRHYRQMVKGAGKGEGAFYLHLWLQDENGNHVQPDGPITVCLPYPEGADSKCDFVIEHYEDDSHTRFKIETCERRADGIYVTLSDFSPFMLSWSKEEQQDDDSGSEGGNGGSSAPSYPSYPFYPDYEEEQPSAPQTPAAQEYIVLCRKLNVRAGAGTQYEKIGTLRRGQIVGGVMLDNGWVRITMADGSEAYICAGYVEATAEAHGCEDGQGSVVCRKLNVRAGAGTKFDKVGSIRRGDAVRILGCDGTHAWLKIEWENETAWVCAKYINVD